MWQVTDKWGNLIELTDERWQHILENHWELSEHLDTVLETVQTGKRKQSRFPTNVPMTTGKKILLRKRISQSMNEHLQTANTAFELWNITEKVYLTQYK